MKGSASFNVSNDADFVVGKLIALCLCALDTNSLYTKNVRRNEEIYEFFKRT